MPDGFMDAGTDVVVKTLAEEEAMQCTARKRMDFGWIPLIFVTMIVSGGFTGCASTPWSSDSGSGKAGSSGSHMRPTAYDFPDVLIPNELEVVSGSSYVFQGPKTKAGLLVFKGRVETKSVIDFFQTSMPRENWKFKGGFRYKRSVLVFEKPEKICLINIHEDLYYTYVEIYLTPMEGQL
jgi:hypothetical protein